METYVNNGTATITTQQTNNNINNFAMLLLNLQHNPLDLLERDLVIAPIVELGRARAFMRGHLLRVFEETAVHQLDGDPGGAE